MYLPLSNLSRANTSFRGIYIPRRFKERCFRSRESAKSRSDLQPATKLMESNLCSPVLCMLMQEQFILSLIPECAQGCSLMISMAPLGLRNIWLSVEKRFISYEFPARLHSLERFPPSVVCQGLSLQLALSIDCLDFQVSFSRV